MMVDDSPAESARRFIHVITDLSDRLGAEDVVVRSLRADWGSFGSWILETSRGKEEAARREALRRKEFAAPGPEVWRITWDGKERLIRIESSPSGAILGPNRFTSRLQQTFDSLDESIAFAEDYLLNHLK